VPDGREYAGEHGLFRAGENLLAWLEKCQEAVGELHDAAHALREYAAGRTRAVDVRGTLSRLLKAVEDYNRLACGAAKRGARGLQIDPARAGRLARAAAGGDRAAGERLVAVAYGARREHEKLRRLLSEAELPAVGDYLFNAAASERPDLVAGELARMLGLGGERR
jgi:hypothetical protein